MVSLQLPAPRPVGPAAAVSLIIAASLPPPLPRVLQPGAPRRRLTACCSAATAAPMPGACGTSSTTTAANIPTSTLTWAPGLLTGCLHVLVAVYTTPTY